jgi:Ser-tRNA(Ala) deacylase AlaX
MVHVRPRPDELQRSIELRKVATSKQIESIADIRIVKISGVAAQEAAVGGSVVSQVLQDRRENNRVLSRHT